jgi:hypothetical protein
MGKEGKVERRRMDYSGERPHSSLAYQTREDLIVLYGFVYSRKRGERP